MKGGVSKGVENEIVDSAEQLEVLPGVVVRVARIGHLLALKILAGRLQDRADSATLLALGERVPRR